MFLESAITDWLASKNYYYNTRTNKISDNINDLIEPGHIHFHPEGLCNYLDYGFTVYGQTAIDEIKMLEPNMKVCHGRDGKLIVEHLEDPFNDLLGMHSSSQDTLDVIEKCINGWVNNHPGKIILPLSGGFDSRLILSMIRDRDRVFAYTYGISRNQGESQEVVYAKAVAHHLGINWEQVILDDFAALTDEWCDLFGVTTHAHGMYHMEFYKKIKKRVSNGTVISGIFGDLYAGNWRFGSVDKASDLKKLAITHGLHADSRYCLLKNDHQIEEYFYEKNKHLLSDENWRLLTAARMKISLLSYLLRTPEVEGFDAWSPFLDENVVAKMLVLPWDIKERRKWQIDYFREKDLLAEEWGLICSKENTLDKDVFANYHFEKLDFTILGDLIEKEYLDGINDCIEAGTIHQTIHNRELYAWFTIYPIQKLLKDYK